jgi:hypothetical protein
MTLVTQDPATVGVRRFRFVLQNDGTTAPADPEAIAAAREADRRANPRLVKPAKTEAERNDLTSTLFSRVAEDYDRQQVIDHSNTPIVHRNGSSRERRPGSTRRRTSRNGSRAGPDEPHERERALGPHLTPDLRRWLRLEVDRRRREVIERGFLRSNPRSSRLSRRGTSLVLVIGLGGAHDGCVGGRSLLPSRTARGRLQGHMDFLLNKFRTNHGRWNLSHPLTFCAWCGRVRLAGRWLGKPRELEVVAHARRHATSGICPSCFAELERGSAP